MPIGANLRKIMRGLVD